MPETVRSDLLIVRGGRPLTGETEVRGSKNSATKMMVASLLTDEPCLLHNIPLSTDIDITKELCETIGSDITAINSHSFSIETREIKNWLVPQLSRRNRIPILALGPLLHRKGAAEVPVLGGCYLGHRPINFHLDALSKMMVRIERREQSYYAETDGIQGADIEFPYPSVGATENILLAAVLAKGATRIKNAAVEPEILHLIEMLRKMGARIEYDADKRTMTIEGVNTLRGGEFSVLADRNEVVSFAIAALATAGEVLVHGANENHLKTFLEKMTEIGGTFQKSSEGIVFSGHRNYRGTTIETAPHPGFMTDWQQPFCVLLTQAEGTSIIHETVYEDRFGYTKDLVRMGANIEVSDECLGVAPCRFLAQTFNHSARIVGPTPLHGAKLTVTDLRAGMAHIIAALTAEGESVISGVEHIDRGYEKIDERLRLLGADIERVDESQIAKQKPQPMSAVS